MKLQLKGDEELRAALDPEALLAPAVSELLRVSSREAAQVARHGAPGSVARTIQSEVRGYQSKVYSTHAAALPIEVGRRAGAPPPPPGVIAEWARRKGIDASPFVLARSIARRGIKGRFFLRAASQHTARRLPSLLAEAFRDLQKRWQS